MNVKECAEFKSFSQVGQDVLVPIPGYEGFYSISPDGKVFSHYKNGFMATQTNRGGYIVVSLKRNGHHRPWELHALLMRAFVGPCPDGREVDHRNRIKTDNRLSNLRYVDRSLNTHNAVKSKHVNYTKFRGVVKVNKGKKIWCARIRNNGEKITSRYFLTDTEAALEYDRMAYECRGESAITNKGLGFLP